MSKSFFSTPPAIALGLKNADSRVTEAIRSGNPPERLRIPCEKCGSLKWQYQWGNKWRCTECGIWVDSPAPEVLE